MSGTSSDGQDVALCSINNNQLKIIDSVSQKYSKKLQMEIIELNSPIYDDLGKSKVLGNKITRISYKLINKLLIQRDQTQYKNIMKYFIGNWKMFGIISCKISGIANVSEPD